MIFRSGSKLHRVFSDCIEQGFFFFCTKIDLRSCVIQPLPNAIAPPLEFCPPEGKNTQKHRDLKSFLNSRNWRLFFRLSQEVGNWEVDYRRKVELKQVLEPLVTYWKGHCIGSWGTWDLYYYHWLASTWHKFPNPSGPESSHMCMET